MYTWLKGWKNNISDSVEAGEEGSRDVTDNESDGGSENDDMK